MIKHILADGMKLKSTKGRLLPPSGRTGAVYGLTVRERFRQRKRRRLIKRLAALGAALIAAAGVTSAISAAIDRREAAEPPLIEITAAQTREAATEPAAAPQQGKVLGWDESDKYRAVRMAMAEAEGEDTEGKALVILVIWNRTQSRKFPDTVKGVISQQNAFTSCDNGRYEAVKPDEDCWAALDLIQKKGWDESRGALYFERTPENGESTWHSRNLERLFIHGNHTFYTEKEAESP